MPLSSVPKPYDYMCYCTITMIVKVEIFVLFISAEKISTLNNFCRIKPPAAMDVIN